MINQARSSGLYGNTLERYRDLAEIERVGINPLDVPGSILRQLALLNLRHEDFRALYAFSRAQDVEAFEESLRLPRVISALEKRVRGDRGRRIHPAVLIAGIGMGREITYFHRRFGQNLKIIGVDHSPGLVAYNRRFFPGLSNINIVEDDLLSLESIHFQSVDGAYLLWSAIFEFSDGEKVHLLNNLYKKIRYPGYLVIDIAVPDERGYVRSMASGSANNEGIVDIRLDQSVLRLQPVDAEKIVTLARGSGFRAYIPVNRYRTNNGKFRELIFLTKDPLIEE